MVSGARTGAAAFVVSRAGTGAAAFVVSGTFTGAAAFVVSGTFTGAAAFGVAALSGRRAPGGGLGGVPGFQSFFRETVSRSSAASKIP